MTAIEHKQYYQTYVVMRERTEAIQALLEVQQGNQASVSLDLAELHELQQQTLALQQALQTAIHHAQQALHKELQSANARRIYAKQEHLNL
ncbi:hypothetical protein BM613_09280 [Sulfoacidibacillus thermotolerans]|uniref:Uncharacterized protein n=2 Tax=Sulfoacidibacillus thermotolerans TaxID=1765684 RepID=A0A2U3D7M4_SULT2|nr:hypothetical protein BM613_09280 [Sulfoacidibacillus thermotolerans]